MDLKPSVDVFYMGSVQHRHFVLNISNCSLMGNKNKEKDLLKVFKQKPYVVIRYR